MKIGIAGIGGIGSNVARHLVQAGVTSLKIVDFDFVEISNLNRQFYRVDQAGMKKTDCLAENLHAICSGAEIETVDMKIEPCNASQIFEDCSIVVEGLDDKHLKKMFVEELSAANKTVVSASGIAGQDMTGVTMKKIGSCRIVGDLTSDQDDHDLFPPKIALVAAHMAAIVLTQYESLNNHTGL